MTIPSFTLQEFRYLVSIADTGSFRQAAAACFVTQPTLSTQLKKFEDGLGVRLVERTNKTMRLTPIGEKITERARLVLNECESIAELARTHADPFIEPFRVGIISTLGPYLLPRLLPALKRGFPKLKLVIREGLTKDLLTQLHNHELEAVMLALPVSEPGLSVERLFEEQFWLVCPEDHPLAQKRSVAEPDLAGHAILLLSEGHCLRDQALDVCGQRAEETGAPDTYRATSLETLRHLVAAGFGCTLLPTLSLQEEWRRGSPIRAIPFASGKAQRTIGLVWRRSFPRSGPLEQLAEFIARKSPGWLTIRSKPNKRRRTSA